MHAIRVGEKLLREAQPPMRLTVERASIGRDLSAEEVAALTILLRFAKRVVAAKDALRSLARAVAGEDELNQNELPLGGDEKA
jgi:phage terminase large subunit-like protein